MKVKELMTRDVITVGPEEPVEVAARTLAQYNIGALPVCGANGKLLGLVTDRDLVTRCMASGKPPAETRIYQIMTGQVTTVSPDMAVDLAAHLMGRRQIRRLPVTENGRLCGMVSLGDLASREDSLPDAADAMMDIAAGLSQR